MLIRGGPGTGRSVLAINLLVELTKQGLVCRYVSKNAAPRAVFQSRLAGVRNRGRLMSLFSGSGAFVESEPDVFDALIVDEAHRLNENPGLYGNLGEDRVGGDRTRDEVRDLLRRQQLGREAVRRRSRGRAGAG